MGVIRVVGLPPKGDHLHTNLVNHNEDNHIALETAHDSHRNDHNCIKNDTLWLLAASIPKVIEIIIIGATLCQQTTILLPLLAAHFHVIRGHDFDDCECSTDNNIHCVSMIL